MKENCKIFLDKGHCTTVDPVDYEWLKQFQWKSFFDGCNYYARAYLNGKYQYMHRSILDPPDHLLVDHINGDTLDNSRDNLRVVTPRQNAMNRTKRQKCSSRYKGVTLQSNGRWRSKIKINGKDIHLGYYDSEEVAAMAYNQKALEIFGEYARLNTIPLVTILEGVEKQHYLLT